MLAASGCGKGYKTTHDGLLYKFEKSNPSGQQVQEGDVLVGEMTVKFDTSEVFNNVGHADRILRAIPSFKGDIYEGLLMMHIGDKASFVVSADSIAKFLQPNQMPHYYKANQGMKIQYDISLQDIITKEELDQEENNFQKEMTMRREKEPNDIADYVKEHNITANPTSEGLYVIVTKLGNGPKIQAGSEVSINYTGRLLDGTIFDSSVESDAIQGGIQQAGRKYEPLTYTVGRMGLIRGWEEGVMGKPQGTKLQLIIPSAMAYGPRGHGDLILPFTPLVFDLEIVSVK